MDHPNLTAEETAVVEHARAHFSAELLRRRIPAERWAHVTLGLVVDLAGQTLRLVERDTEPPAALCNVTTRNGVRAFQPLRHCTLPEAHDGDHSFEEWPP